MQEEIIQTVVSSLVYYCFVIAVLTGGYGLSIKAVQAFTFIKNHFTKIKGA